MKTVITGASGQDGIFLIDKILRETKSEIFACTRKNKNFNFNKLKYLNNNEDIGRITVVELDYLDFTEVFNFFKDTNPDYVFNLMGPSSVKKFIENPEKMKNITNISFKNIINSLIETKNFCNFYQASSSEMYGYDSKKPFDENSKFKPNSFYAKTKYSIHQESLNLMNSHNWNIVSGIMFNHESEFRNYDFLVMKLVKKVIDIKKGSTSKLEIPSLEIERDWTYAKEISEAAFELIFNNFSGAYVIGSGTCKRIDELAYYLFNKANLNYKDFITVNDNSMRDGEPLRVQSNPLKIKNDIGWKASKSIYEVLDKMYDYTFKKY